MALNVVLIMILVQILRGTLQETLYDKPAPGQPPQVRQQRSLIEDTVGYMSDDIGLHKIFNASDLQPAVSLHRKCRVSLEGMLDTEALAVYTPPWAEQHGCHVYGAGSGNVSLVKQRFYSEYGRICGIEI